MRQLLLLISVELKEYIREPGIIFWAILFPILLALGLGMAFSGGGNQNRTIAVICTSGCPESLADGASQSVGNDKIGLTAYTFKQVAWDQANLMLKKGETSLVLESTSEGLIYHFDPANADAKFSYLQLSDHFSGKSESSAEITILKQDGTRYIDFLVPGLLAMGIMMSCMWGISYSNVEKRSKKLLRRMVATPMKRYNYVISMMVGRLMLSALEASLLVLVTMLVFGIKITGSFPALLLMFLAGNIAFGGLAWLLASRTAKSQIANGLINLVIMPMMILSGIYFSYHNFPDVMITVIKLLPLTILADNIRSIFIEGATLTQVLPGFGILCAVGVVFMAIGMKVYKWY